MKQRDSLLIELRDYFQQQPRIQLAILYGSYARGTAHTHSDIDIAIHAQPPLDSTELMQEQSQLVQQLGAEVDLVQLQKIQGCILNQILQYGVRVKDHSQLFARYNLQAIYYNEDYLPALRRMQDARIRSFIHGS